MGKYIETNYSHIQKNIIKKPKGNETSRTNSAKKKRKLQSAEAEGPDSKRLKENNDKKQGISQSVAIEVKENLKYHTFFISLVNSDDDLFSEDLLKNRYDQYTKCNFLHVIYDEIALEGLDGITLEALWKRLHIALNHITGLNNMKKIIWKCICANNDIQFFELPEARKNLIIINRYDYVNEELGIIKEVNEDSDIYKIECAPKGEVLGSCADLANRIEISDAVRHLSLQEAYNTYKNKLVIVANQKLRTNALYNDLTDTNYDITPIEYCILEKIGRGRECGEVTQGSTGLCVGLNMDPKSLYHYRNKLINQYLITNQFFCIKSVLEQNIAGRLLHIRKFYVKNKSKNLLMAESIISYLKRCPGLRSDYNMLKKFFQYTIPTKFFKNTEFLKYVKTNELIPYREFYPNATKSEYMIKSCAKERSVNIITLRNPYINIAASWPDDATADSSDDEDENDDSVIGRCHLMNLEFTQEMLLFIKSKGLNGCTAYEMCQNFDIDFPTVRLCIKKLLTSDLVFGKKLDVGKQRVNKYIAKHLEDIQQIHKPQRLQTKAISAIERLKQKQKRKIDSVTSDRIYTHEHFEAELNLFEKPSFSPMSFNIPSVVCIYFRLLPHVRRVVGTFGLIPYFKKNGGFTLRLQLPQTVNQIDLNVAQYPVLNKIGDSVAPVAINDADIYIDQFKPDSLIKAFQILILLDQLTLNPEIIDFFVSNDERSPNYLKRKLSKIQDESNSQGGKENIKKENHESQNVYPSFMGSNPILVSNEKQDKNVHIKIVMSTPPASYVQGDITTFTFADDSYTDRLLSRIQMILDKIQACKIADCIELIRMIRRKEQMEDKFVLDKKSLHRILQKLIVEGYVKVYRFIMSELNLTKILTLVCHPEVNHDNVAIKGRIEQMIWRCFGLNEENITKKPCKSGKPCPFGKQDVQASIEKVKCLQEFPKPHPKPSRSIGNLYGYRAKFSKMAILHELLFYLIYVLNKETKPLSEEEILRLFRTHQIILSEEDLRKMPPIYCRELSWKMFIPPLPYHQNWNQGWALICDVILRIPISIITKLDRINFSSTELQEILLHPIKRFYLLNSLSPNIRSIVMYKRKYVTTIYQSISRLAYCGLVQFGPSKYHEKDQSFIYLNRKASLLETMYSEPGYHKISVMDYPKLRFQFNMLSDVINYWAVMHKTCTDTPLNARAIMDSKTITLEWEQSKPSLQKVFTVRTPEEVEQYDNGDIPGDQRGAGGLDSALWSHIKKNWFYMAYKEDFKHDLDSLRFNQVVPKQITYEQLKVPTISSKFYITKPQNIKNHQKPNKLNARLSKGKYLMRKIKMRPKTAVNKRRDEVDKAILKSFSDQLRLKPCWTKEEDKVLTLLKIAAVFLNPKDLRRVVQTVTIRDILHRVVPISRNKIADSLARRWKILTRDNPVMTNIDFWVTSLSKLDEIVKRFLPLRSYLSNGVDGLGKPFKLSFADYQNAFVFLSFYIFTHRKEVETALDGNITTIDYLNKENINSTKANLVPLEETEYKYTDPTNKESISKFVLKGLFHSNLADRKENPSWSFQQYKVYTKFSDAMLKDVMKTLKEQKMMVYKRDKVRKFHTPFKISFNYISLQCTAFSYSTVKESYESYNALKEESSVLPQNTDMKNYGSIIGLNEILIGIEGKANFIFSFPEKPFILNPNIEDHNELIEELAKRYQLKIKNEQKEVEQLKSQSETETKSQEASNQSISKNNPENIDPVQSDEEDEPLEFPTTTQTIDNLKNWISNCIDMERVRSPSPELLVFEEKEIKTQEEEEYLLTDVKDESDQFLSIEDIKREMLVITSDSEKRNVPYITDLTKLLTENFDELETDERITALKKHFVPQYPSVEKIYIDEFNNMELVNYIENLPNQDIWNKMSREQILKMSTDASKSFEDIVSSGGGIEDVDLANTIIYFISTKEYCGASALELKEQFYRKESTCSLESILTILIQNRILLKTGVCTLKFVHHKYASAWLLESFTLDQSKMPKNDMQELDELQTEMEKTLELTNWIHVYIRPWVRVDGVINKELLKLWLTQVLSYCIEKPGVMLNGMFEKFSFLCPVDVFYLIEILEKIGCLELRLLMRKEFDIFDEYGILSDRKGTFLDSFDELFIQVKQAPFVILGSFLKYV